MASLHRIYRQDYFGDAQKHLPQNLTSFHYVCEGETEASAAGLVTGMDDLLNAAGMQQGLDAKAIIDTLNIKTLVCSPTKRARQMAKLVSSLPINTEHMIKDRNFGKHQNTHPEPAMYLANYEGCEDTVKFASRVARGLARCTKEDTLLVGDKETLPTVMGMLEAEVASSKALGDGHVLLFQKTNAGWKVRNLSADPRLPSQAEYDDRIARAQAQMKKQGLDVLALAGVDINRFFTGLHGLPLTRPIWLVLRQVGGAGYVSPGSEVKEIKARCNTPVVARWVEWVEAVPAPMTHQDALAAYLKKVAPDARKIGVDFNGTTGGNIELVRQALGPERIEDVTALLRDLLAIKDAAALRVIRLSCDVITEQFNASKDAIAPGAVEWKVALASFVAGTERAADLWNGNEEQSPLALGLHMTGSGHERTARCHAAGAGRVMQDGDIAQVCRCSTGFYGHLIGFDRPVQVGSKKPSPEMRKVIDYAREAQEAALNAVRPGNTTDDVHNAAMAVINRGGWKSPILHRTGRSIGYSGWDGHEIKAGSSVVFEKGMVFTVEPGIYVEGIGGARFGDTVLVTDTGCEVLTPYDLGRDV